MSENEKQDVASEPKTVDIDVSSVPEDKRSHPEFVALLADMQRGCSDARIVHAICVHEAAHAFFLARAGYTDPLASGPKILYDAARDKFDGQGSTVQFRNRDKEFMAKLKPQDWLGRVAKAFAAGGIAARVLAGSVDRGDGDDRENFNAVFQKIKRQNPAMTLTSDSLWAGAQAAVEEHLENAEIRQTILGLAETLKPDLFHES